MCVNVEWLHCNISGPNIPQWCYLIGARYILWCINLIDARYTPKCSTLICASNINVAFNTLTKSSFFYKKKTTQKCFSQLHTTALFFSSAAYDHSSLCFKQTTAKSSHIVKNKQFHWYSTQGKEDNFSYCGKLFNIFFKNSMD